jgi:hypothetical protein
MKKLKLYLDDIRIPLDESWILVKDYNEFVNKINLEGLENFEIISLDHDLGVNAIDEYHKNVKPNQQLDYDNIGNEKTGYDCAKFLVQYSLDNKIDLPKIQVHSANPIGSINIINYINNFLKKFNKNGKCIRGYVPHKIHGV